MFLGMLRASVDMMSKSVDGGAEKKAAKKEAT
jgi:hypothetical protein